MLFRFCLYGFLKNQRYFEPFLLLAFLDKGLSYLAIGWLIAIRSAMVHLLEIPSGAAADLFGRRRAMVLAFAVYLASFIAFSAAETFWPLAAAMALFGVGEAFRTGSHKALIFAWLKQEGRADEKTRVYGLTRAWSKYGSAVSALIAAALVYLSADYTYVFIGSTVPCALSIVNLLGYPSRIDPRPDHPTTLRSVQQHMAAGLKEAMKHPRLRRCLGESMTFNGVFFAAKDYLQPALVVAAALWLGSLREAMDPAQQTAVLSGPIYFLLFLAAGIASRNAFRLTKHAGSDEEASRWLWVGLSLALISMTTADYFGIRGAVLIAFVALYVLQNLWKPILTSRIYAAVDERQGATILSIESQAHRLVTMALAPLLGWIIDTTGAFWPAFLAATLVAFGGTLSNRQFMRAARDRTGG